MEDTLELAWKLIISQTKSLLYGFDKNEACSPSTVEFPDRTDPFNVVTKFCILDVSSPLQHYSWEVVDPHDESSPVHQSSIAEVPYTIQNDH